MGTALETGLIVLLLDFGPLFDIVDKKMIYVFEEVQRVSGAKALSKEQADMRPIKRGDALTGFNGNSNANGPRKRL
jgi:hypothetical protein